MKKAKIIVVALMVALLTSGSLIGCFGGGITGSGNPITENYSFGDFTRVEVGYAFDVEISRSSSYSVSITADDNLFDYIEVSISDETLYIGLDPAYSYRSFTHEAIITMPDLYGLDLSGATRGTVQGFSLSHDFSVDISGASRVSGNITAADARFDISGASRVELEGLAEDIVISASGASSVELDDFPVHNADVNLSGASRATVNLLRDGRLDVNLSGASNLQYFGRPTMGSIDISGGSTMWRVVEGH